MNETQQECFELIYKSIHDEHHDCSNLVQMIGISFPLSEGGDEVTELMHRVVGPYLIARANLGEIIMEKLYKLKEEMDL